MVHWGYFKEIMVGYGGYPLVIILVMKHGYKYEAFGFWENPQKRKMVIVLLLLLAEIPRDCQFSPQGPRLSSVLVKRLGLEPHFPCKMP